MGGGGAGRQGLGGLGGGGTAMHAARYAAEVVNRGQVSEGQPQLSCPICHTVSHNLLAHVNDYAAMKRR